jgi:hypothetical protein
LSFHRALKDGVTQLEIDLPSISIYTVLGGDQSKTQFDDFDTVQEEFNKNRDRCIELLPNLARSIKPIYFILPDLKEVELTKEEWTGQRFRQARVLTTSIEPVADYYSYMAGESSYAKIWGATFASGVSSLLGGSSGDASLLEAIKNHYLMKWKHQNYKRKNCELLLARE